MLDVTMGPGYAILESTAKGELPLDVLTAGVRRLSLVALSGLALIGLTWFGLELSAPHVHGIFDLALLTQARIWLGAGLVLSLLMFALTKLRRARPQAVLSISVIYIVLLALVLSAVRQTVGWSEAELFRAWSPIAGLLIIYGAMVPARPSQTLSVCLCGAATEPIVAVLAGQSNPSTSARVVFLLSLSPAFGAILAYLCSRSLYGLTEHITKAREVGSYFLEERLGVGGMGEVWSARHQMLARPAAIKLIRRAVLASHGPEESRRLLKLFEREAQTTANLTSPHTIVLYDYGVTLDGTFFYVMELLDGYDLQTLVKEFGPQPAARVAHILMQACDSLHEAHEHQLVHRDLKPANIFTCRHGGKLDFVKVLDFGLVMDRRPTAEELEKPGLIGTPAVMAPEMVRFNAPVDQRADIYALGCVGYWMLTGERVFDADNRADMLVMHAHQRPVLPSRRAAVEVPAGLEQLIMRCLLKNPDKRPQTAQELGDELGALGLHQAWTREKQRAFWQVRSTPVRKVRPEPSEETRALHISVMSEVP